MKGLFEKFSRKDIVSPWKKDKGAIINSPVYEYSENDEYLGVVYGCFSPFTGKYGHARLLENGLKHGIKKFIIVSPNKKQPIDNDRNMFTLEQKVEIEVAGCKDLGYDIVGAFISKEHFFLDALYEYAEKFPENRLVLLCGPDREETYARYCIPFGETHEISDENDIGKFEMLACKDRGDKEVSGTAVRQSLRDNNKKQFMNLTGYSVKMWNMCRGFMKENGVLDESVKTNKQMLTEDTHSLHIEDSILKGPKYTERMLGFFDQVIDTLAGNEDTDKPKITIKIDGAPAITMFSKFGDFKGPGVSTKSIFNANPKYYTTDEEIDADSRGEELKKKLKAALKLAKSKIIPDGEIWQGDLLFTKGDIKDFTEHGKKYIYFKPNTLVYAIPAESESAKKALNSDIGIVFHTRYVGNSIDNVKQSNDASTNKLKKIPSWAFVMDARIPNVKGADILSDDKIEEYYETMNTLEELCDDIIGDKDYEPLISNEEFINFYVMTLQNNKVDNSESINPDEFVDDLHEWIKKKMHNNYTKLDKLKTKAGRDKKRSAIATQSNSLHDIVNQNEELLYRIAEVLSIASNLKTELIEKLNSLNNWVNKVETKMGMKDTNGEGFMVSDVDGNFVKLVDRSAFSYFNRSPDVIKGFEDRRGSANESKKYKNFNEYIQFICETK